MKFRRQGKGKKSQKLKKKYFFRFLIKTASDKVTDNTGPKNSVFSSHSIVWLRAECFVHYIPTMQENGWKSQVPF